MDEREGPWSDSVPPGTIKCNLFGFHVNRPNVLLNLKKLGFTQQILIYSSVKFTEIHPVGEALIRVEGWKDGQIEITGVIVAFRDYANVTKIVTTYSFYTVCKQI